MNALQAKPFMTLDPVELEAWADARACDLDLPIAEAFRPAVLDNLAVLQGHAKRLSEALAKAEAEGASRAAQA
jgi:hypothetical protein